MDKNGFLVGGVTDTTFVKPFGTEWKEVTYAEVDGLARRWMLPRASRQLGDGRTQFALLGRRGQKPSDDGKAQSRPPFVNT